MYKRLNDIDMGAFHTPSPNLGECKQTGTWDDPSYVQRCQQCLQNPDAYGTRSFFCGGKCMSIYDLNSGCNVTELVAKDISQCTSPCVQSGFPSMGGNCSDKFDCQKGQTCKRDESGRGQCVTQEQYRNYYYNKWW
jgi:hypothetical protein